MVRTAMRPAFSLIPALALLAACSSPGSEDPAPTSNGALADQAAGEAGHGTAAPSPQADDPPRERAGPVRARPRVSLVQGDRMYEVLPRDAIPAIDQPVFVPASEARFMEESEPVLGVDLGDPPKAYPLHLLDHHEIVNDTAGGRPIVATW